MKKTSALSGFSLGVDVGRAGVRERCRGYPPRCSTFGYTPAHIQAPMTCLPQ